MAQPPTTYWHHREKLLTELLSEVKLLRQRLSLYEDPFKTVTHADIAAEVAFDNSPFGFRGYNET